MRHKIFLLDVLPGELATKEITGYLSPDIDLVINLPQNAPLPAGISCGNRVSIDTQDEKQIETVVRHFGGVDAIKLRKNVPLRRGLLHALTSNNLVTPLKIIGQAGVGLNHIDTLAAEALGIDVFNTAASNALAVAEFTLL